MLRVVFDGSVQFSNVERPLRVRLLLKIYSDPELLPNVLLVMCIEQLMKKNTPCAPSEVTLLLINVLLVILYNDPWVNITPPIDLAILLSKVVPLMLIINEFLSINITPPYTAMVLPK